MEPTEHVFLVECWPEVIVEGVWSIHISKLRGVTHLLDVLMNSYVNTIYYILWYAIIRILNHFSI